MRQDRIFDLGFALSTLLLLIAAANEARSYSQHQALLEGGFSHVSTSAALRWSMVSFVVLNLPAVAVAVVACSIIARLFNLSAGTTIVTFLPLALYLSAYWWKWLAGRFGRKTRVSE